MAAFGPQFAAGARITASMSQPEAASTEFIYRYRLDGAEVHLNALAGTIHAANVRAGWWSDPATGQPIERNVFEMLALVHSEISEALEGHRKGLADDKLPQYPMIAVELADAVIRILDLAGAMQIPLGEIVAAKARFNATRADHRPENRRLPGGKAV